MDNDVLLHIDGRWRPAGDGRVLPVVNPATGAGVGTVPVAGPDDLDGYLTKLVTQSPEVLS